MTLGESINNAFGDVYILSLKSCYDRREYIKNECDKINLKYQFFDAYDGVKLFHNLEYQDTTISNRFSPYPSSARYYAAQVSADVIVMNAINNDLKSFVLLNDDIYWENYQNFTHQNFLDIKNKIPNQWDIIILGNIDTLYSYTGEIKYDIAEHYSGCHGIVINNILYHDWLKYSAEKQYVGDGFVEFLCTQKNKIVYSLKPDVCLQNRGIPTTITKIKI